MVFGEDAREDVEELLTKEIVYHRLIDELVDLSNNESVKDWETAPIMAQVTIQRFNKRFDTLGLVKEGDLVGLFRYEYCYDLKGRALSPKLVPKKEDKITFLGRNFVIKECTPATGEDDVIIGYDFTAGEN